LNISVLKCKYKHVTFNTQKTIRLFFTINKKVPYETSESSSPYPQTFHHMETNNFGMGIEIRATLFRKSYFSEMKKITCITLYCHSERNEV